MLFLQKLNQSIIAVENNFGHCSNEFCPLSILIISLRFYQENHLNKLFNHYLDAKTQTINPILNEKEKQYTIKLPLKIMILNHRIWILFILKSKQRKMSTKSNLFKTPLS